MISALGNETNQYPCMPNNYSRFTIEDFAFDERFQHWVRHPDSEHRPFWEKYLAEHPQQTDKILAARQLVIQLTQAEGQQQDPELAHAIWQNVVQRTQPVRRIGWLNKSVWRVAASLILVVGLGVLAGQWQSRRAVSPKNIVQATQPDLIEEVNRTSQILNIHLSDGSVVSLSRDSRLTYPRTFDAQQRVVHLTGEAFFEVTKNPKQPFLVYANETVTKVLGTSFRIKAYEGEANVTVAVRTGRVSVFARKEFENEQNQTTGTAPAGMSERTQLTGLVLTPNQQAVYAKAEAQLGKTLVEIPVVLSMPNGRTATFEFENTPVRDVFAVLEKAYGVDIVCDAELIAARSLTVSLEDESLFDKLNVICKTIGLSYQIVDAQVIIENKRARK